MHKYFFGLIILILLLSSPSTKIAIAQPDDSKKTSGSVRPAYIKPDPRVQQRSYHFKDTDEDLPYVLFVSSKVSKDRKNPLIVALHGYGGDGNFLVRERLVDIAEENGYILAGPLGYKVTGWYGIPAELFQKPQAWPSGQSELCEKDVMNVLAIMQKEFNIDENRIYLMGHSMGGGGTLYLAQKYPDKWAAVAGIATATPVIMLQERKKILSTIYDAGIPVMLIVGDKDNAFVESSRQLADTMKELKMVYEYIEFPGGDHGSVKNDGMPDMFRFFAKHSKSNRNYH